MDHRHRCNMNAGLQVQQDRRSYLRDLVHIVVQGGTAARAGMGQPTVLLLQVLDSWPVLVRLAPGALPIPDAPPHKLLNPVHLHLTVLQAVSCIRQILGVAVLGSIMVNIIWVSERGADAAVAIAVRVLASGRREVKVGRQVEVRGEVGVGQETDGRVE